MKVVGLTGFAKSGKSTAADILKELGGQEVAFAKHLKDVCSVAFGIERDHFDNQAYKEILFRQDIVLSREDITLILDLFEVPKRFFPSSILAHAGKRLQSPRHVAQYIGTEVLRSIDSDIHINMAFKLAPQGAKFFICSDCRFDNEFTAVEARGGLTVGISRKKATPADLTNLHGSEREVPTLIERAMAKFENEGTIEEFQAAVRARVTEYLK